VLKRALREYLDMVRRNDTSRILTKWDAPEMIAAVWDAAHHPSAISKGASSIGLFPFNPQWLERNRERIMPATATFRPPPANVNEPVRAGPAEAAPNTLDARAASVLVLPATAPPRDSSREPRRNGLGEVQSAARAVNTDERLNRMMVHQLQSQLDAMGAQLKRKSTDALDPGDDRPSKRQKSSVEQDINAFVVKELRRPLARASASKKELCEAIKPYMAVPSTLSRPALISRVRTLCRAHAALVQSDVTAPVVSLPIATAVPLPVADAAACPLTPVLADPPTSAALVVEAPSATSASARPQRQPSVNWLSQQAERLDADEYAMDCGE